MNKKIILSLIAVSSLASCTIIRPGEVGVKRRLGKLSPRSMDQGVKFYNPFLATMLRVPVRTVNLESCRCPAGRV